MNRQLAYGPPPLRPISNSGSMTPQIIRDREVCCAQLKIWRVKLRARERQVELTVDDSNRHARITALHGVDEAKLMIRSYEQSIAHLDEGLERDRRRAEEAEAAAIAAQQAAIAARQAALAAQARRRARAAIMPPQATRSVRSRRVAVVRAAAKPAATSDPDPESAAPTGAECPRSRGAL